MRLGKTEEERRKKKEAVTERSNSDYTWRTRTGREKKPIFEINHASIAHREKELELRRLRVAIEAMGDILTFR